MSSVLGYTLERATQLLTAEGYTVKAEEVRSRKGQPGNERRVVRVKARGREILLTYAVFQTELE